MNESNSHNDITRKRLMGITEQEYQDYKSYLCAEKGITLVHVLDKEILCQQEEI